MSKTPEYQRIDDLYEDGIITKDERVKMRRRFKNMARKAAGFPVMDADKEKPELKLI